MMYKIVNDNTALYLCDRFNLRNNERYELRGFKKLTIPKPNTNYKKRSLGYRGAVKWNALDDELKSARNVKHFKHVYKQLNNNT